MNREEFYLGGAAPARGWWRDEIKRIERETGVSFADMKSQSRYRPFVRARWAAWAMLRRRGWSLPRIGALFNRDHTTIFYGLRELERRARKGRG